MTLATSQARSPDAAPAQGSASSAGARAASVTAVRPRALHGGHRVACAASGRPPACPRPCRGHLFPAETPRASGHCRPKGGEGRCPLCSLRPTRVFTCWAGSRPRGWGPVGAPDGAGPGPCWFTFSLSSAACLGWRRSVSGGAVGLQAPPVRAGSAGSVPPRACVAPARDAPHRLSKGLRTTP